MMKNIEEHKLFVVKYSVWLNIELIIYSFLLTALFVTILIAALWIASGTDAIQPRLASLAMMYLGVPIIMLPITLPNFIKQNKMCRQYRYDVFEDYISVRSADGKRIEDIVFADIQEYQLIAIGYSVYTAVRVLTKHSQKIVIYRTMSNYRRFLKGLKRRNVLERRYVNVRIGTYEDNVL